MLSREEMFKGIDAYFKNTTKEQFITDLEELDCLDMVEDVPMERVMHSYQGIHFVINESLINLSASISRLNSYDFEKLANNFSFKKSEIVLGEIEGQSINIVDVEPVHAPIGAA